MGAGRFFCLFALLAAPAAAKAQPECLTPSATVSPFKLLAQGAGLELRDGVNRPISRGALARQLKAGERAEAAAGASPAAKARAEFLERVEALAPVLRNERQGRKAELLSTAPVRPPKLHRFSFLVRHAFSAPRPLRPVRAAAPAPAPDRALVLPLRC